MSYLSLWNAFGLSFCHTGSVCAKGESSRVCRLEGFILVLMTCRYRALRADVDAARFVKVADIVAVGNVLIDFLRELPEPLIPYCMYESALSLVREHVRRGT